jgi:hypothetical protein
MPLIETARWRIPKENHDRMLELARVGVDGDGGLDYQRKHPEKLFYRKTRTFCTSEEGSAEETWFFIDEYDDLDAYEKAHEVYRTDPDALSKGASFREALMSLIVPRLHEGTNALHRN